MASITRPFAMDFASELQNVKGKDAKPLTKDDYWTQQKRNGWLTAGIAQFRIALLTIASSMPPNFNELFATTSPAND